MIVAKWPFFSMSFSSTDSESNSLVNVGEKDAGRYDDDVQISSPSLLFLIPDSLRTMARMRL